MEKKKRLQFKYNQIDRIKLSLIIEILYIFIIEVIFKLLRGNLFFDWSLLRILISSSIISGIVVLITSNLNKRVKRIILTIFNFIVSFYAWLEIGLVDYLGAFMSVGNVGQGTKATGLIGDFLESYRLVAYTLFIPFILTVIYYVFESKITKDGYNSKIDFKDKKIYLKCFLYYICLSLLFAFTINVGFMQNKYQTVTNKELFKYPSNPLYTIKNYGITMYFLLDIKGTLLADEPIKTVSKEIKNINDNDTDWIDLISREDNNTLNNLNYYYINRDSTKNNEYTGIFKDKNLIMILLESVGYPVFTEEYKEYFPTLYKLQNEGISALNNYSPRNSCATGESEMMSVISLYPVGTSCTVNAYEENVYPESLFNQLKNNGYYTSAYHGQEDRFYNRNIIEENFGSIDYFDASDLNITYGGSKYKEWPSDVDFIKKSLPNFINKNKFASYMITVTSHFPYIISTEYGDKYLNLFKDLDLATSTKRYLSKIKVVDLALEELLSELENAGILDDTVIVLFGDHYPYAISDREYNKLAPYEISNQLEVDRTPFIIYNVNAKGIKIDKFTSPLDYAPTILNLFGIDYDARLYIGHDIFSDYTDYVAFPDNSWINSSGYYLASKGSFYKNFNSNITESDIIKINNEIDEKKSMSALSIKRDYFNYLYENIRKD